jgi:hypothetical protein
MSKQINVNPGQYKVAGRERPGEDVPEPERSKGVPKTKAGKSTGLKKAGKKR